MKNDIHATITYNIIAAIESGNTSLELPWQRTDSLPLRVSNGMPYRGVNTLALWAVSMLRGYGSPYWGGFRTWQNKGGRVRKGEKSSTVVHSRLIDIENKHGETETIVKSRSFAVFNRDQVAGLENSAQLPEINPMLDEMEASAEVEALCKRNKAHYTVGGSSAHYDPRRDVITMPDKESFVDTTSMNADLGFASTLAHELIHWTGHKSRCDRFSASTTKASYAFEELIAELGSAFLCNELNFGYSGVAEHTGYIDHWLQIMKGDKHAIFTASGKATTAVRCLIPGNTNDDCSAAA